MTPFEEGFLIGLLVGEGHFGGDGKTPQVTLKMHVRHEGIFRWLQKTFPGGRLYGPYTHSGRHYFQWMVRGRALRDELIPLLEAYSEVLDDHVRDRIARMCEMYAIPWFPAAPHPGMTAQAGGEFHDEHHGETDGARRADPLTENVDGD